MLRLPVFQKTTGRLVVNFLVYLSGPTRRVGHLLVVGAIATPSRTSRRGEDRCRDVQPHRADDHEDAPHRGQPESVTLTGDRPIHHGPCCDGDHAEDHSCETHFLPPFRFPGRSPVAKEAGSGTLQLSQRSTDATLRARGGWGRERTSAADRPWVPQAQDDCKTGCESRSPSGVAASSWATLWGFAQGATAGHEQSRGKTKSKGDASARPAPPGSLSMSGCHGPTLRHSSA